MDISNHRSGSETLTHSDVERNYEAAVLELTRATMPFDVCCRHTLPGEGSAGRCQLWAGHDGEHGLMISHAEGRVVRTWSADDVSSLREPADYRSLPWARGFPQPAWHESPSSV